MWISTLLICDTPSNEPTVQIINRWFNNFILNLDTALHSEITQDNVERVFTVSPFYLPKNGYPSWIRITSIDDRLNQLLRDHLPELCGNYLQLDSSENIRVSQVHLPKTLPSFLNKVEPLDRFNPLTWLGHISPTQLITAMMTMPMDHRLRLFFHTSTSLRNHSPSTYIKSDLVPLPQHIFESYTRRWQTLTSSFPMIPLSEFVGKYTRLSRYNLRTNNIGGWHWGYISGFTGYADYTFAGTRYLPAELARDREYLVQSCYLLAAFSFFVGTGQLTSFGLGQTLPVFL